MKKIGVFVACSMILGSLFVGCAGAHEPTSQVSESDGANASSAGRSGDHPDDGNDDGSGSNAKGVSSPFIDGVWKFDQEAPCAQAVIADTEFRFLNPTPLELTLEYAFFDTAGNFCGCDVDTLEHNQTTTYTMFQELEGGFFIHGSATRTPSTGQCSLTDKSGSTKAIVFRANESELDIDGATQVGFQTHVFRDIVEPNDNDPSDFIVGDEMSEAQMAGIQITPTTRKEIQIIHDLCTTFQSELKQGI